MIASFKMDESYYKEDLSEWTSFVSRGRNYKLYLCEILLLFGTALLAFFPSYKITGIAAILLGIYELIKHLIFKKRWLKERIGSEAYGKVMVVEFKDGEINLLKTGADQVKLLISKVRVVVSRKGYFIYPGENFHIYVPFSSFSPAISRDEALKFMQVNHRVQADAAELPR
jgi:hypothetical protein